MLLDPGEKNPAAIRFLKLSVPKHHKLKPGVKESVVDNLFVNLYDLDIIHDTKGRGE